MLSFYCRCIRCQPFDQLLQIVAKLVLSGIAQFVTHVDADVLIQAGDFKICQVSATIKFQGLYFIE